MTARLLETRGGQRPGEGRARPGEAGRGPGEERARNGRGQARTGKCKGVRGRGRTRHRQVTDLDVKVLGFSGPGLPSARKVLCGDAPRLFFYHVSVHLSSVLGRTELLS